MTETQLRQKYADTAIGYLGAVKGSAQHLDIVNTYNAIKPLPMGYKLKTSDAWCAATVSAMASKAGLLDIIPAECSCPRQIALWQKMGRWMEKDSYVPQTGDIIYYDWQDSGSGDNTGTADHVGIVCYVRNGAITVIEGNKGSPAQVGYRNIAVNGRYIRGFGLPNYASKATAAPVAPVTPKPVAKPAAPVSKPAAPAVAVSAMPLLKLGSKGANVEILQNILIGLGYGCGKYGADGDFGASTKTAVIKFQKGHNLIPDGEVGALTWNAIKVALPNVANGAKGKVVKALQLMLNAKGFSCGTADGEFGKKTYAALINYQKSKGLTANAVCDQKTWGMLIIGRA